MIGNTQSPGRFSTEREYPGLLRIPVPIGVKQMKVANTTILTARDDADFQLQVLTADNVTATNAFLTLYLVESGGTAGVANTIVYQKDIAGKDFNTPVTMNAPILIPPGYSLIGATGTNDAVNVYGWGYDYQGQFAE